MDHSISLMIENVIQGALNWHGLSETLEVGKDPIALLQKVARH
jgi:hypothetical protein